MVFAKFCIVATTHYQSWWPKSNTNVLCYNFRHQKPKTEFPDHRIHLFSFCKASQGGSPFSWWNDVWVWLFWPPLPHFQCAHRESPGSSPDSKVSWLEPQIAPAVLTLSKLSVIVFLGKRWASSGEDDLATTGYLTLTYTSLLFGVLHNNREHGKMKS